MQSISPTLLAAATRLEGEPIIQALLEDRRIRWKTAYTWEANPDAPVAQYDSGTLLLRATTGGGGPQIARVANRTSAAAWEAFFAIATDAQPGGDVAVAWMAPWTWHLAYEGANHQVLVRRSTDNGLTWGPAAALHTASQAPWVAAWGAWVFVLEGHLHGYTWNGTAWQGPYTLPTPTPSPGGVAVYHDPGAQWAHILYSAGGRLYKVELDTAAMAYTSPRGIAPGGDQPASAAAWLTRPSLTRVMDLGLVATWVEGYTGPLAGWGGPVSAIARDDNAQHFGQFCPLAPSGLSGQRWHLAYDSQAKRLYAGNRRHLTAAPVFDADIYPWMHLGPVEALAYRRTAAPHEPGRLRVEMLDPTLSYRRPGEQGSAAEVAKPLTAVRLRRGYRTALGPETVDTPNYYLTQAVFTEGQGGGRLCLEATDAFGLLDLWHPTEPMVWYGRSIRWLLEEIGGRVGLRVVAQGVPRLEEALPHFTLHPRHSGLEAVHALLRLGQAVARPAADDALEVLAYPSPSGSVPAIGAAGEIRSASYGHGLQEINHVRVVSEAYALYAEAEDTTAAQALGQRFSRTVEDNRLSTASAAEALAAYLANLAHAADCADQAAVPLRPDLEPWDIVALYAEGISPESPYRLIRRLEEEAAPARNRYESRLWFGAVPL